MNTATKKYHHARDQILQRIERIQTYVNEFDDNVQDVHDLNARYEAVESLFHEFDDTQLKIEYHNLTLANNEELVKQSCLARANFETKYFKLKSSLSSIIKRLNDDGTNPIKGEPASQSHSQLRLPKIDLKKFDGKPENWLSFFDVYTTMIHENKTLSAVQKFYYLRSSVTDEAALVIQNLEISIINYDIAWGLLKDRYANPKLLVKKYIADLLDLPVVPKESSLLLRQLSDRALTALAVLDKLGQPVENWDMFIITILSRCFDSTTRREWESTITAAKLPTSDEIFNFLKLRCIMLEALESNPAPSSTPSRSAANKFQSSTKAGSSRSMVSTTQSSKQSTSATCKKCRQHHHIYNCSEFLQLDIPSRRQLVQKLDLCFNCLKDTHQRRSCTSTWKCKLCSKNHNTLLHLNDDREAVAGPPSASSSEKSAAQRPNTTSLLSNNCAETSKKQIFLSTAQVHILNSRGKPILCRALLDSASESNFMTENLCKLLNLKRKKLRTEINGIAGSESSASEEVSTTIQSRFNGFSANLDFLILNQISAQLPSRYISPEKFCIPQNINLADASFFKPSKIDLLIGAEIFYKMLCIGQIKLADDLPDLQKTAFGWIVSGKIIYDSPTSSSLSCQTQSFHTSVSNSNLNDEIAKFWELEECQHLQHLTADKQFCEDHFTENIKRSTTGRFIVKLPFKVEPERLGDSYTTALRRFKLLEKRFSRQPELKKPYVAFVEEYDQLGHMEEVLEPSLATETYYLPHHPVLKPTSSSTKLRVVFDASAKSSSGLSLNNILLIGPTVQDDLFAIISRFRLHKFVMTADVTKMYRQVLVDSSQTDLQRIIWRNQPEDDIKIFRLNTITYGTSSAPYLATRCLNQVSIEKSNEFPKASEAIRRDFYIDDLMTGGDDIEEVVQLQTEIINILKGYGFSLHKWCSNNNRMFENIQPEQIETSSSLKIDETDTVKTLGLLWQHEPDQFRFSINLNPLTSSITKRSVLSEIARIFDPLGFVGPVITTAKIFMQTLWKIKLDWDESLPLQHHTFWIQFRNQLLNLNNVPVPRWVLPCDDCIEVNLHVFCDASLSAYGACLYLVASNTDRKMVSNLHCSKSRVSPVKVVSIPRLELCGALLSTQLTKKVCSSLNIKIMSFFFWTDSTIVLSWLKGEPSQWKPFVGNRVSEIQQNTKFGTWRHVPTDQNPADLISRGVPAHQLINQDLWWHGPAWLCDSSRSLWPEDIVPEQQLGETTERRTMVAVVSSTKSHFDILEKYSSLSKCQRIVAYCLRFWNNRKEEVRADCTDELSTAEMNCALLSMIKISQRNSFSREIIDLKKSNKVNSKSNLLTLNAFLDEDEIIRVGGRLKNSLLNEGQKHQIVLSSSCHLTKMIMVHYHLKNLHAGQQALLAYVRQQYWPLSGRTSARETVRNCVLCVRAKPVFYKQLMGDLPPHRVQPSRPFINSGVDYAGPLFIRRTVRGATKVKAYIALFVCMATKAVHLELVTELTTSCFIGALKRFMARRGKISNIYSDNATNFVGANNELQELRKLFLSDDHIKSVNQFLLEDNISWHFIPPRSPHFGGLWESSIKSAKKHLIKVTGSSLLTFEELNTLIIQIEAVLNSRPLTPLSEDPNDLEYLSPGHFLIGSALNSTVEPSLSHLNSSHLSRWQRVQQMYQAFWSRWSSEYLPQLQQRNKWNTVETGVEVDALVVMKEDNLPPLQWKIGRVVELHKGTDGRVRVATVKTTTGLLKRGIVNLCKLPIESNLSMGPGMLNTTINISK